MIADILTTQKWLAVVIYRKTKCRELFWSLEIVFKWSTGSGLIPTIYSSNFQLYDQGKTRVKIQILLISPFLVSQTEVALVQSSPFPFSCQDLSLKVTTGMNSKSLCNWSFILNIPSIGYSFPHLTQPRVSLMNSITDIPNYLLNV